MGLLKHKKLPDTCLFGAKDDAYGAEGIRIHPVEPLKTLKVDFDGVMQCVFARVLAPEQDKNIV